MRITDDPVNILNAPDDAQVELKPHTPHIKFVDVNDANKFSVVIFVDMAAEKEERLLQQENSHCSATTVPTLRRQRLHYTRSGAATTFINGSACTVNDAPIAAVRTCNQSRPPLRNAATIDAEPSFVVLTTFIPQQQPWKLPHLREANCHTSAKQTGAPPLQQLHRTTTVRSNVVSITVAAIAAAQAFVASSETLIWEREGAATCHSPNEH
ncbi:hypothetical protein DEO72_LG11g1727 [Vigna unguiculata]|uniref:Uncharacterized protein n=1 Tax=Vigna unguiculata TaxID=3917 RepID=A0A4D6NNY6_VIGUN|nr:hypothetical protein DEO72_LG11g1727 [Vigna unguiculata]